MTKPPETHIAPSAAAAKHGGHRLLSPARYQHPGDMIRLIIAGLVLAVALAVTAVTHATYAGASAVAVSAVAPSTLAGRVLGGVVHALFAVATVAAFLVTLRYHRYRLLGGLAVAAVVASGIGPQEILADDRALQPAENITPVVRRDVVARYGTRMPTLINAVSARLATGSPRSLNAQAVLDGRRPRSAAEAWLRAQGLMQTGGVVH